MSKEKENDIVYIQLDDWNDMGDATTYLKELQDGKHDNEINYCEVWYDMAILYCITTTRKYVDMHPELEEFIDNLNAHGTFTNYYPKYDPEHFGCMWYGEYKGWAPYKEFDKQLLNHLKETGQIDEKLEKNYE